MDLTRRPIIRKVRRKLGSANVTKRIHHPSHPSINTTAEEEAEDGEAKEEEVTACNTGTKCIPHEHISP
jgi:hypothetical protein